MRLNTKPADKSSRRLAAPRPARAASSARPSSAVSLLVAVMLSAPVPTPALPILQERQLTPLQSEVRRQQERLASGDVEVRRDAVMRLGAMGRPESSRAASAALGDPEAIVRATAAQALLGLGPEEASALLLPLLRDRDEFVRRETAYALGKIGSAAGVAELSRILETDRSPAVRGAAAVALGQIADPVAAPALAASLTRRIRATGFFNRILRRRVEEDEFVRRSAAVGLGRIGRREAVPVLIEVLSDARQPGDVRREAARALGLIGDPVAVPALRSVTAAPDPHLARIALEALRKMETPAGPRGN